MSKKASFFASLVITAGFALLLNVVRWGIDSADRPTLGLNSYTAAFVIAIVLVSYAFYGMCRSGLVSDAIAYVVDPNARTVAKCEQVARGTQGMASRSRGSLSVDALAEAVHPWATGSQSR